MSWETIHKDKKEFGDVIATEETERMKVPGGWLVSRSYGIAKFGIVNIAMETGMAMVFVSDPDHKWEEWK